MNGPAKHLETVSCKRALTFHGEAVLESASSYSKEEEFSQNAREHRATQHMTFSIRDAGVPR